MWDSKRERAHRNFRLRLEEHALKTLLKDGPRLQRLRTDWDGLRALKKSLSNALKEWKVDLDKEVLKASTPGKKQSQGGRGKIRGVKEATATGYSVRVPC